MNTITAKRLGRRSDSVDFSPLRGDPTQTRGIRRAFAADLARRFEWLKRELVKLIVTEDVFGLKPSRFDHFTTNADYSSTQVNIKHPWVLSQIRRLQSKIDPQDVLEWEREPHIT